jgi:acetoin utilization protein AcuC
MTQRKQSSVALVWSEKLGQEPAVFQEASLQPERLLQAYQFMESVGLLGWDELYLVPPDESLGALEQLGKFHEADYCDMVAQFDNNLLSLESYKSFGFSKDGTMPFEGMKEVATRFVAAARTAVQLSLKGESTKVMSLAGEQYHAHAGQAEAGHIFNDVALALLDARVAGQKVAFINLEAEHAKVIQELFFDDSSLLTISLHEGADFLYPSTGHVEEIGRGEGRGFNINLPMPPGAGDAELLKAFEEVALPILKRFNAELVLLLAGSSAHVAEPLAHLRLTSYGYQQLVRKVMTLAPHLVLLGGGGTKWDVTARLWTLALATLAELDLPSAFLLHDKSLPALPITMQEYVNEMVEKQITKARELLFPHWELPLTADISVVTPSSSQPVGKALPDNTSRYEINNISHNNRAKGEPTRTRPSSSSSSERPLSHHATDTDKTAKDESLNPEKDQQSGPKESPTSEGDKKRKQQSEKRTSGSRKRRRSPRKKSSQKSRKENE